MKKIISILITASLVFCSIGTAFAANTVDSAMYGDDTDGSKKTQSEIEEDLTNLGITDVNPTDWAAGSITILVENGYMTPGTDGLFKPNNQVSGDTGVTVLAKVLGIADKNDTPEAAIQKARDVGLVSGSPAGAMSRLDTARLLAKAFNITPEPIDDAAFNQIFTDGGSLSSSDKAILAALYKRGILRGYPDKTFKPGAGMTNAELAVLVDRLISR